MKVLISGTSGLIGSAVLNMLESKGYDCYRLVRYQPQSAKEIYWNFDEHQLDPAALECFDAVIHLAGESIVGNWTTDKKKQISHSRIDGTRFLCQTLMQCKTPPKVFIGASAIGYYGSGGEYDETSEPGHDFLAKVCVDWESESKPLETVGTRRVLLRLGMVLSPKGGALKMMLPPFKMGGGGTLGSGRQMMSWVTIDDVVGVIEFALTHDQAQGPINVVAPKAVSNAEFTKALGKVLKRPTIAPVPGFMVKLLFGEMGETLMLSTAKVKPERLSALGYGFKHPDIEAGLSELLGSGS